MEARNKPSRDQLYAQFAALRQRARLAQDIRDELVGVIGESQSMIDQFHCLNENDLREQDILTIYTCYHQIAQCYVYSGDIDAATRHYQHAINSLSELRQPLQYQKAIETYMHVATLYSEYGQLDDQANAYNAAENTLLDIAEVERDHTWRYQHANICWQRGNVYEESNKPILANESYLTAIDALNNISALNVNVTDLYYRLSDKLRGSIDQSYSRPNWDFGGLLAVFCSSTFDPSRIGAGEFTAMTEWLRAQVQIAELQVQLAKAQEKKPARRKKLKAANTRFFKTPRRRRLVTKNKKRSVSVRKKTCFLE